jgi:hypothetical protein
MRARRTPDVVSKLVVGLVLIATISFGLSAHMAVAQPDDPSDPDVFNLRKWIDCEWEQWKTYGCQNSCMLVLGSLNCEQGMTPTLKQWVDYHKGLN